MVSLTPHHHLKILQTCFSGSWGGLEIQALEVSRQLQLRGHDVWLACCARSRLEQEASSAGLRVISLKVRGYFHPTIIWKLRRFLLGHGIDLVHCQLSRDIATMVPAVKLTGRNIPILLSKRVGSYLSKRDILHRFTYANVHLVLAVSEVIRRNVLDTTPMTSDRVLTFHDAIDAEVFSPDRVKRAVRKEFGIDDATLLIGFVGRFSPGKGHEELLRAIHILRSRHAGLRVLIVGEASFGEQHYERQIKAMCASLGLNDVVTFTGFRNDIPEVMGSFDIFVFPSHAESFGVALIEAMAMELPVVSTNCDGVLDIVVDGETGLYVRPGNNEDLAAGLERLILAPELRQSMGKAGRKRVLELFDRKGQMERLEAVYAHVIT